jgi:methylthioribose-1-phosphate isomerase
MPKVAKQLQKSCAPHQVVLKYQNLHGSQNITKSSAQVSANKLHEMPVQTIQWDDDRCLLRLIDQNAIPFQVSFAECSTAQDVAQAIADMTVRGAPAIGVAAAYGVVLGARKGMAVGEAYDLLLATRPTAVNLRWALERMVAVGDDPASLLEEAKAIHEEDRRLCNAIGNHAQEVIPSGATIMTLCNTGALATTGIGTAYGAILRAHEIGKVREVLACETRPRMQGLRLTAFELHHDSIPFRIIPDGAAASAMRTFSVNLVLAGADRIAANGDTANKIGTLNLAVLAQHFGIPFYIAAPSSTIDPQTATGTEIPIEERSPEEILRVGSSWIAPETTPVWNPAFDVTPAHLISGIITERGVHRAPYSFK